MKNYTGKTVSVGIDVHKKTYSVTCVSEGAVVKQATLKAEPMGLVSYLKKHFANANLKTVYESGFSGFVLHRFLVSQGIDNTVVHAASVEISARDRVKTDKRDSLKLATQLSHGRLRCIYVPTVEREAYREMSRLREKLVGDKRRVGNRLKSLLVRQGLLGCDDDEKVSLQWLKKVEQFESHPSVKYCIEQCIAQWRWLAERIRRLDSELATQAKADEALEKVYRSAPGIGPVHARNLANELGDMQQFSNEKKLFSFTGLTPSEYSSGEHKRQGHISRQGRSLLRKVLIQAAWKAIYVDASLQRIYENTAKVAGKKRAIVGIARRLIGRIRSCFANNVLYQRQPICESVCKETGEVLMCAIG